MMSGIDKFEGDEIKVAAEERVGYQFLICARGLYTSLSQQVNSRQYEIQERLPHIKLAIVELGKLWEIDAPMQKPYVTPQTLRDDYIFAKRRYEFTKVNPDLYRERENKKRDQLQKERTNIINKIKNEEIEFAHAEDRRRLYIKDEVARLKETLRHLESKKHRYETDVTHKSWLPVNKKRNESKLLDVQNQIVKIESDMKEIVTLKRESLENRRYQLRLLNKRRWDIDRSLQKVNRWQNAVDNAEIVKIVRSMDIEFDLERHYSACEQRIAHAYLNVYALLSDAIALMPGTLSDLKAEHDRLTAFAAKLYCPELQSRSVLTLYGKLSYLTREDREQVIRQRTSPNQLPVALLKTLSVKTLKKQISSQGLYRKVLPNVNSPGDDYEVTKKR